MADIIKFTLDRNIIVRARILAATFSLRSTVFRHLLEERRFNPDQPRIPRGFRHGRRWVDEGDDFGSPSLLVSHDGDLPELPEDRPPSGRERHRVARIVARYIEEATVALRFALLVARFAWLADQAAKDIIAYLDGPKTLEELRTAVGEPKAGYDIHHIVEKTSARRDGFSDQRIESPENRVRIPRFKHWEITGWFAKRHKEFGDLSPRQYLEGASWEERYAIGIKALEDAGVLTR